MKIKYVFLTIILSAAIIFCSCTNTLEQPQNTESPDTEGILEMPADPFESVRSSGEEWLSYGLAAYENGKQVENLKEFFSDYANMTYLTLYDHFFTYDKDKSVPVAEALFAYIYNEYGVEALLDLDKRCEYKTAFLKSLGLDVEYINAPEAETFLASMDFSSNETYKYIISFDNVTYYFKDFSAGSPTQYHGFLYYSTTGLFEMIEYMKSNNLSEGFDTERKFNYYPTFDGSGYSMTVANGDMYINEFESTLHEAVHAIGVSKKDNIWLSEGICNYFGKSLGFNDQIVAGHIQILTMAEQGYFDERVNSGDKSATLIKKVYEAYTTRGGKIDSLETFDYRLYSDVASKVELDIGSFTTLGEAYKFTFNKDCNAIGGELSYDQATSLILYLVDIYGIEEVLEAYHTQNIKSVFGKDYENLKSEWLSYLK